MEGLDQGFDNGLQRVLDGIEFYIASRGAGATRGTKTARARRR